MLKSEFLVHSEEEKQTLSLHRQVVEGTRGGEGRGIILAKNHSSTVLAMMALFVKCQFTCPESYQPTLTAFSIIIAAYITLGGFGGMHSAQIEYLKVRTRLFP